MNQEVQFFKGMKLYFSNEPCKSRGEYYEVVDVKVVDQDKFNAWVTSKESGADATLVDHTTHQHLKRKGKLG